VTKSESCPRLGTVWVFEVQRETKWTSSHENASSIAVIVICERFRDLPRKLNAAVPMALTNSSTESPWFDGKNERESREQNWGTQCHSHVRCRLVRVRRSVRLHRGERPAGQSGAVLRRAPCVAPFTTCAVECRDGVTKCRTERILLPLRSSAAAALIPGSVTVNLPRTESVCQLLPAVYLNLSSAERANTAAHPRCAERLKREFQAELLRCANRRPNRLTAKAAQYFAKTFVLVGKRSSSSTTATRSETVDPPKDRQNHQEEYNTNCPGKLASDTVTHTKRIHGERTHSNCFFAALPVPEVADGRHDCES